MNTADSPLKQLFIDFDKDMVEWLLAVPVQQVRDAATELQPESSATYADCVLELTLMDGRVVLLHVEFQTSSTHEPMRFRMLDYDQHFAKQTQLPVCSIVLYVGCSAGARDTGKHQVLCPITGEVSLHWQYRVVHLWKLKAEQLLALENSALLTLIGQTQVDSPEVVFPQVLDRIWQIDSAEQRESTLTLFMQLLSEQDWFQMIAQLVEHDDVFDTPMLRRDRQLREEAMNKGRVEALRRTLNLLLVQRFGELSKSQASNV